MKSKVVIYCCMVLIIVSCSHFAGNANHSISSQLGDRKTASFTGKGAGAGMMLMSSMGPMGIAIGVAIDEGIAKDIHETLVDQAFSIEDEVVKAFEETLKADKTLAAQHALIVQITINKYGFKTYPGGNDSVSAWLDLSIDTNGKKIAYTFPDSLKREDNSPKREDSLKRENNSLKRDDNTKRDDSSSNISSIELELAKSNGREGVLLLEEAATAAAAYWFESFATGSLAP